mmetsp:Transcript_87440/g.157526  ORF Transcript_87440/g.157526 Transcript_87440/m.157526 type:complete len:444 (+) Transcript_87440:96-1427(+)
MVAVKPGPQQLPEYSRCETNYHLFRGSATGVADNNNTNTNKCHRCHLVLTNEHVPAQDPLHDGARQHDQVERERQNACEARRELEVEAGRGQGEADDLIQVGVVRIEDLLPRLLRVVLLGHDAVWQVVAEGVHEALADEAAAAKPRVEGADDGLDEGGDDHGDNLDGGDDGRRDPVLEVLAVEHGQHRAENLAGGQLQHLSDAQRDGHGPRELHLQRGNDSNVGREEVLGSIHEAIWSGDGNHGHLGFAVDELIVAELLHVHNPVLVVVQFVVDHVGRFHQEGLIPADCQLLEQLFPAEVPEGLCRGDGHEVLAPEEAEAPAKYHLDDVRGQQLVDLVELLGDPHVDHDDNDGRLHQVLHGEPDALLQRRVILKIQAGHEVVGAASLGVGSHALRQGGLGSGQVLRQGGLGSGRVLRLDLPGLEELLRVCLGRGHLHHLRRCV